jgi:Bifunctional DNA primase/polymerase, N-terminal/Primase C terminal 1 (PriCT-1)
MADHQQRKDTNESGEKGSVVPTGWGAGWSRENLVENGVRLAELGFGIVGVYYPVAPGVCSCPQGSACGRNTGKHPIGDDWPSRAEFDPARVRTMLSNPGIRSYGNVPPPGVFGWDEDGDAPDRLQELTRTLGPLPPTRVHRSGNGRHAFYRMPTGVPGGSRNLFGVVTRWAPGGMTVGPGSVHAETGRIYTVECDLAIAELPEAWARAASSWSNAQHGSEDRAEPGDTDWKIPEGRRHSWLVRQAARLRATGLRGEALAAALLALNVERCDPPKPDVEVRRLAQDYDRKADGGGIHATATDAAEPAPIEAESWPAAPAAAAYHGVLGEIALAVAPLMEADRVAVLGTNLVMFGAACGGARTFYQGSMQRANLSVLLVGGTGFSGRKGTALDLSRTVFHLAYPDLDELWLVGVASGEAISGHLERKVPEDRVLIVEPEFGRILTIMNRQGSTLSPVLRNAWDGVPLGYGRARDESLVPTHHVALLGHITPIELRQKLTEVDAGNGFANRLLFLAVRRSQLVAFPVSPDRIVQPFLKPLHLAIIEAQAPGVLAFDDAARDRWEDFYVEMAMTPRLGLAGAVTGRHEAQVARLALVYALADRSPSIGVAHLEAAIALAEFARRSAIHALGDSTGNRHADVLRRMLEDGELSWKEAKQALGLRTAADMAEVVAVLLDAGVVEVVSVDRQAGGRPRRVIQAKAAKGAKDARGAGNEERESAS